MMLCKTTSSRVSASRLALALSCYRRRATVEQFSCVDAFTNVDASIAAGRLGNGILPGIRIEGFHRYVVFS